MKAAATQLCLLPLSGLVAFPHCPPLRVGISSPDNPQLSTVGLIHRRRDGRLAQVGTTAAVHGSGSAQVLECEGVARFRVVKSTEKATADGTTLLLAQCEPFEDRAPTTTSEQEEEHGLHAAVWADIEQLLALSDGHMPPHLRALRPGDGRSAAAFSLALAGSMDLSVGEAAALLACDSSTDRLRKLKRVTEEASGLARAQAALRSLSF